MEDLSKVAGLTAPVFPGSVTEIQIEQVRDPRRPIREVLEAMEGRGRPGDVRVVVVERGCPPSKSPVDIYVSGILVGARDEAVQRSDDANEGRMAEAAAAF